MDVIKACEAEDSLCVGCLSSGRRLERLEGAARRYFEQILRDADVGGADVRVSGREEEWRRAPPLVCWECAAGVRGTLQLRARVATATAALSPHQEHPRKWGDKQVNGINIASLTSLSRLSCHCNAGATIVLPPYMSHTEDVDSKHVVEVSFIKLEYTDTEQEMADDLSDEIDHLDDKEELMADLKPHNFTNEGTRNHKTRKKTKQKQKLLNEDFDESDDEPLTLKKLKQETRNIKGRRKNVDDAGSSVGGGVGGRRGGRGGRARAERAAGEVRSGRVTARLQRLNVPADHLCCVLLSWDEVEAEKQRMLSSEQYTRLEHRCELCAVGFNHRAKLQQHMLKHQPSAGELECGACHVRCRTTHALAAHRRRHRVRWRCVLCGGQWSRAAVAADHLASAHRLAPPTHVCNHCGHVATSLGKLRTHLKSHTAGARCELCGKTLRDRASLRTHLQIHRGEKEFACPAAGCGRRFVFKKAMQLHAHTHHTHQQLYCAQCDVSFKNATTLSRHLRYSLAHVPPARLRHACPAPACRKRFLTATRLQEHTAAIHTGHKTQRCTHTACSFAGASRSVLRAHVRSVHRGEGEGGAPRRDHVCHACGKQYTSRKTLEGHLRAHAGERPYACAACGAAFSYSAALYNHTRLVHHKHKGKDKRKQIPRVGEDKALPAPAPAADPAPPPPPPDRR